MFRMEVLVPTPVLGHVMQFLLTDDRTRVMACDLVPPVPRKSVKALPNNRKAKRLTKPTGNQKGQERLDLAAAILEELEKHGSAFTSELRTRLNVKKEHTIYIALKDLRDAKKIRRSGYGRHSLVTHG